MSRIKNVLNNIVFRRILVIFIVGLVSRSLVNLVFDINVFKDYTSVVSLIYYGCMACFSGFVSELPSISINVFNIKLIRNAIKMVCEGGSLGRDKMYMGMDNTHLKYGEDKPNYSVCTQDDPSRPQNKRSANDPFAKSAGLYGLYGENGKRNIVGGDVTNNIIDTRMSFKNRIKCRLL
jgi:hypothetical protein